MKESACGMSAVGTAGTARKKLQRWRSGICPAAPADGAVEEFADEAFPLDDEEGEDAERVEEDREPWLAEADGGGGAGEEREEESPCGQEGDRRQVGVGGAENGWDDMTEAEEGGYGNDEARGAKAFRSILDEAPPDIAGTFVHAAGSEAGGIEKVGMVAGRAEIPGESHAIVDGTGDGGVTARGEVGFPVGEHELADGRGGGGIGGVAHAAEGKEAEQDEVDERDDEGFGESAGDLAGDAAGEHGLSVGQAGNAAESTGQESDIGIHEENPWGRGMPCELVECVILAAPSGGELGTLNQLDAGVSDGADRFGGAIGRVVIEDGEGEVRVILGED